MAKDDFECKWMVDEVCTNDQCPMCADYCPVPDTSGVCQHENRGEKAYQITPKGIAAVSLMDAGLISTASDERLERFWDFFHRNDAGSRFYQKGR